MGTDARSSIEEGRLVETFDIFKDITERTGGSVYIGVVGPVRTGKSTFIKRFMDLLVLPNMKGHHERERTQDELPQGGAGKQIMTTQPHFVPDDPVTLSLQDGVVFRVRLVDCVGYPVEGAQGFSDDSGPRMVRTPWSDDPIPFSEAAEIGTRKASSKLPRTASTRLPCISAWLSLPIAMAPSGISTMADMPARAA